MKNNMGIIMNIMDEIQTLRNNGNDITFSIDINTPVEVGKIDLNTNTLKWFKINTTKKLLFNELECRDYNYFNSTLTFRSSKYGDEWYLKASVTTVDVIVNDL